jgi:DNA-binding transcriptional ArsR family regulator
MSKSMDVERAAHCLAELGHPIRLNIFRLLVQAGPEGLPVGAIQERLAVPASTLAHHLAHLAGADLIAQRREGRQVLCQPRFDVVNAVIAFVNENCCTGAAAPATAVAGRRR